MMKCQMKHAKHIEAMSAPGAFCGASDNSGGTDSQTLSNPLKSIQKQSQILTNALKSFQNGSRREAPYVVLSIL